MRSTNGIFKKNPSNNKLITDFAAYCVIRKALFLKQVRVVLVPAVEDNGFFQKRADLFEVGLAELGPLGDKHQGIDTGKRAEFDVREGLIRKTFDNALQIVFF